MPILLVINLPGHARITSKKELNMFKKKEHGFSLVELSVAAAVATALAVVAVTVVSGTATSVSSKGTSAASVESCTISEALAKSGGDEAASDCGAGGSGSSSSSKPFTVYTEPGTFTEAAFSWNYGITNGSTPTLISFNAGTGVAVVSFNSTYSQWDLSYATNTNGSLTNGNYVSSWNPEPSKVSYSSNNGIVNATINLPNLLGADWMTLWQNTVFRFDYGSASVAKPFSIQANGAAITVYTTPNYFTEASWSMDYAMSSGATPTLVSFDSATGVAVLTISVPYSWPVAISPYTNNNGVVTFNYPSWGNGGYLYSNGQNVDISKGSVVDNNGVYTITLNLEGILGSNWATDYKNMVFKFDHGSASISKPFSLPTN